MTERTLQRRITEEGVSFRQVINETRQELVRQYLADPTIGINEAAFLLGYEDPNSFYRAFRSTENALLRLPFKAVAMFRPGFIQPLHGSTSKTRVYRYIYALFAPIAPALRRCFPQFVTTTEQVAHAMLHVAKHGAPKPVLESRDINAL